MTFFKGVNPWFWSKNGHFSNFFLGQYRPGKFLFLFSFFQENFFLKGLTHFSFVSKNGRFSNFFFLGQYRPGKFLFRYSRTKKRLSRL